MRIYFNNVLRTFRRSANVVLAHSTCAFFAAWIALSTFSAVAGLIPVPRILPSAGQ